MLTSRNKRREVRTEEMLEGFIKTFAVHSLDKTTIQKLAQDMDMTPSLIYSYFTNKDDIIFKCTRYHHEKIQKGIIRVLALNSGSDLRKTQEQILEFIDSKLDICTFLLQVMAHPQYHEAMEESKVLVDQYTLQYTNHLCGTYEIEEKEAQGIALLINSIINDYILKKSKVRFFMQFDSMMGRLTKRV